MKILVDPDSVPTTLDECLGNIKQFLDAEDIKQITAYNKNPFLTEKIGAAVFLKAAWSLTDVESLLVKWFKSQYGIDDGDQISSTVLHCLYCDVKENPRKIKEFVSSLNKGKKRKKKVEKEEEE